MKVNIQSNYSIFKGRSPEHGAGKVKSSASSGTPKTDLNAITKGGTKLPDKHMLAMKSGVQSHVHSPTSAERLEAIREKIKNGTYHVESGDIAGAIMGGSL